MVELLFQALTIKVVSELKWFLGLHVIRNHTKQTICPSQKPYIIKIYNEFIHINLLQFPSTRIKISELLSIDKNKTISDSSRTLYQQKFGLLLFAGIATKPDKAFAVSQLSKFNQRLRHQYHKAIHQVCHYSFSI